MAVTFTEKYKSGRIVNGPSRLVEHIYIGEGSSDETEIRDEALVQIASTFDGLPLQHVEADPLDDSLWLVTVTYAFSRGGFVLETGGEASSFDTTGGTQRMLHSLETMARHAPPGETAPNHLGAINVNNGEVRGIDIPAPAFEIKEIRAPADADVDLAFQLAIFDTTAKVNNATFLGFEAGELLFKGATGMQRGSDDWDVVYHFAASPNATGLQIGDMTGIDKEGWDWLWVEFQDITDAAAGTLVRRPKAVHIERVFERADFSVLGL